MFERTKAATLEFIESQLRDDVLDRLNALEDQLRGRETDDFGFTPKQLKWVLPVAAFFYYHWFRVQVHGLEKLPEQRVLFIANHSGQIPLDAAMITTALMLEAEPPRVPRSMVERVVSELPYLSVLFARMGQVLGTPENCRRLLEQDTSVLVFPEGAKGISKTYQHAYQLQEFGHGFMRLALETKTTIVPVGVVGAEEQYPTFWNSEPLARRLGLPAFPLAANFLVPGLGLMPLPIKYRIYFGTPLSFSGDAEEDESEIAMKVNQVKMSIDGLLRRGLEEREGYFR